MTRAAPPLMRIPVGVVVERRKASSIWAEAFTRAAISRADDRG